MPRVHVPYPSRVAGTSKIYAQPRAHASDGRTLCRICVRITVLRDYISCPPSATEPDGTRCGRWFSTLSSPITAPHHLPRLLCREEMQGGSVLDAPLLTSSSSCVILILRKEKKIFGLSNCPAIHFAHCYKSGKVDSGTVLRTTRSFIKY